MPSASVGNFPVLMLGVAEVIFSPQALAYVPLLGLSLPREWPTWSI